MAIRLRQKDTALAGRLSTFATLENQSISIRATIYMKICNKKVTNFLLKTGLCLELPA